MIESARRILVHDSLFGMTRQGVKGAAMTMIIQSLGEGYYAAD